MQFVDFANHSIPHLPCVVFSMAFASSEFNLRFDLEKKHLSFQSRTGQSFHPGIHTFVYTEVLRSVVHIFWSHCLGLNT